MRGFRYSYKRQGSKVITDFRRLLESGDIDKLTPGLYEELHMHGGFIAHFELQGFRSVFRGNLTALLDGELHSLEHDAFTWPALEDSGYTDGLSAGDVLRSIQGVARELGPMVREREAKALREAEIETVRVLAAKHGMDLL